jgi:presenilin-like A22 family membrane protease
MASEREHIPLSERDAGDVVITHPNRDKPEVQATRAMVVFLMLATAGLLGIVTIGGWAVLQAAKPIEITYILIYVTMAVLAMRWNRGVLPVSAVLAVLLAIFALVAAPGWFQRDKTGFEQPALHAGLLGVLTLLIVPLQVLLVTFAMRGFQQGWNVEVEQRTPGSGAGSELPPLPGPSPGATAGAGI